MSYLLFCDLKKSNSIVHQFSDIAHNHLIEVQTTDQSNGTIEHNQQKQIARILWTKPFSVLDCPQWSTWVQRAVNI